MDKSKFTVAGALLAEDPAVRSRAVDLLPRAEDVVRALDSEELAALLATVAAKLALDGIDILKPIPN